mmetsp:Transcript_7864/g.20809  ORF Transcript_7864/g.20809 Transcript_7864/m.20809 type:complete len:213 (-) Transcript_7864:21-659(-)
MPRKTILLSCDRQIPRDLGAGAVLFKRRNLGGAGIGAKQKRMLWCRLRPRRTVTSLEKSAVNDRAHSRIPFLYRGDLHVGRCALSAVRLNRCLQPADRPGLCFDRSFGIARAAALPARSLRLVSLPTRRHRDRKRTPPSASARARSRMRFTASYRTLGPSASCTKRARRGSEQQYSTSLQLAREAQTHPSHYVPSRRASAKFPLECIDMNYA